MSVMRAREEHLPFVIALDQLARHPNAVVLRTLAGGPRRFNELTVELAAVPESELSAGLRELDAEHLVARRVDPGPPLRVLYELTPQGERLAPALRALGDWAEKSI
jgi:DNA-binding HxlR family transcriptional regulator